MGVDPGSRGALAFLHPEGRIEAIDMPMVDGEVDADEVCRLIRARSPSFAVIERVWAMPSRPDAKTGVRRGMGAQTSFKLGDNYGSVRSCIVACGIPLHRVTSGKWKNHFGLSHDKEKARAHAIRLWPGCGLFSRKMDEGRSEAALIARYGADNLWNSNRFAKAG
jgi:crossover junction endodeoxyribonuclease RuvC